MISLKQSFKQLIIFMCKCSIAKYYFKRRERYLVEQKREKQMPNYIQKSLESLIYCLNDEWQLMQ